MISIVVHSLPNVNHELLVGLVGPAPLLDRLMMRVLTQFPEPISDYADGADVPLVDGLIYRPLWIELRRAVDITRLTAPRFCGTIVHVLDN